MAAQLADRHDGAAMGLGFAERREDDSLESLIDRADAVMLATRCAPGDSRRPS